MIPCKGSTRGGHDPGALLLRTSHAGADGAISFSGGGQVHLELYVAEAGADEPIMNRAPAVESFYTSWIWRKCRKAFAESKGNRCERCLKKGIIEPGSKDRPLEVHHKVPLTADNVQDPDVALNWANLELLCKDCHDAERERRQKRWKIGPDGRVIL